MSQHSAVPEPSPGRALALLPAVAGGLAVAIPLLLYLLTMPPTITWWFGGSDSGDLVSAADVLGIPHPTGYPLFVLLGHLVTRVPAGEVAGRVNAMNTLLAALGAGGVVLAVRALTDNDKRQAASGKQESEALSAAAALVAALAVALSELYWSQAIIGEVYALHAALTALVLWLWARRGTHPALRGAAHGLALTNHATSIILLGGALIAFARPGMAPRAGRTAVWFAAGLIVPLCLYLLLPIRAAQAPAVNWGDPDTLGRFLAHVTGRQYRGVVDWQDVGGALRDLPALIRRIVADLPPFTLPVAAVGYMWLWDARRPYAFFSALAAAGAVLFTAVYRTPDRAPYLLPAYLALSIWCGAGLIVAAEGARRWAGGDARRLWLTAGSVAVLLLVAAWSVRTERRVNLHGDDSAVVFARATLASLPAGATYFTARDDVTFALWYAQRSLGVRRDVRVVDVRNPRLVGAP